MPDLERPRLALYVALGLAVCLLGARYVLVQAPSGREDGGAVTAVDGGGAAGNGGPGDGGGGGVSGIRVERARGGRVTVHVAGAVRKPGVYRMGPGARVDDALRRAGGARRGADLTAVNLAATLEDGRQVLVPERVSPPASTAGAGAAAAPGGGAAAPAAGAAAPINLNTATLEQLDTLDGVGPGIAQRILDYREQHGAFERVEELGEVPGIGAKRLATLTPLVTV
ncbi:MAG TPA: helix-hairpin-helix domain-containing protein [Solirubrobacteraceae bacterium]|nr:helix-hairpin-helix domain-containing protein [Solirubrobacteraceae bacterium]